MRSAPWFLALSMMWFGWGASSTMLGIGALVIGTAWVAGLFAADRSTRALRWFTCTWTLGWAPAFAYEPLLLVVPLALVVALLRRHRRENAWRRRLREFEEREHRGA